MTTSGRELAAEHLAKYGPPPEHIAQIIRAQIRAARQNAAELREQRATQDGR